MRTGNRHLVGSIPPIPLFLEVGASDKTMMSFIGLGLSRVTARRLNERAARKDLDQTSARTWLTTQNLQALDLSPILIEDVRKILGIAS
jgi:hypothetical protein